jgi:uncharacterized protein
MLLNPYVYKLLPSLAVSGDCVVLEGALKLECFTKGAREFACEDGISYRLVLSNVGTAVLIAGTVCATVHTDCDRCLEDVRLVLEGEASILAYLSKEAVEDGMEGDEYLLAEGPEAGVDLAPVIFSALVLAVPPALLCREDCAGLCANCGESLNEGPCGCTPLRCDANERPDASDDSGASDASGATDAPSATADCAIPIDSPFAALKEYRF